MDLSKKGEEGDYFVYFILGLMVLVTVFFLLVILFIAIHSVKNPEKAIPFVDSSGKP